MRGDEIGMQTGEEPLRIYVDGASRGNPGPAACAFVIKRGRETLARESRFLGRATNNEAEYRGIIAALEAAGEIGAGSAAVFSDSQLAVRQINGEYGVRCPHLQELYRQVVALLGKFTRVAFRHRPRTDPGIGECDTLCNAALDSRE